MRLNGGLTWVQHHTCVRQVYVQVINAGRVLNMGNESTTHVVGRGLVVLKFTSEKTFDACNVLFVPQIRKNLVSRTFLCKMNFRQVYEVIEAISC